MLAVVQMVYPTIKSDARLPLEILYFREIQTRTSPNVWAGRGGGVNRKLDDPSSKLFALSLSVCLSRTHAHLFRIHSTNECRVLARVSLSFPRARILERGYLSIRLTLPQKPPSLSSRPMHLEEMCLYLDSGQIICGNKFLCVQCYVIGFISLPTSIYVYIYLCGIYSIVYHGMAL